MRWRQALAAVLGAVALGAVLVGGVQALGEARAAGGTDAPAPAGAVGPDLPGASDPDAIVPPAGAVDRPPGFAPSAVVPVPLPAPDRGSGLDARPGPDARSGSSVGPHVDSRSAPSPRTTAPSPRTGGGRSREPTSGETQYEYGCRRGYITEGC